MTGQPPADITSLAARRLAADLDRLQRKAQANAELANTMAEVLGTPGADQLAETLSQAGAVAEAFRDALRATQSRQTGQATQPPAPEPRSQPGDSTHSDASPSSPPPGNGRNNNTGTA